MPGAAGKTQLHNCRFRNNALLFNEIPPKMHIGEAQMARGEIQPAAIKVDRIVERIREGDIKIPAFQRGFVWNQEQITELLDSIYCNYPIGSILLWSSHERLKASRNIGGLKLPEREPDYPVNYVLDGQQRLSSIYAVFCANKEYEPCIADYGADPKVFEIAFRFDDESFIPLSDAEVSRPHIDLSSLLDTESFFSAIERLSAEDQKAARQLHSRVNNYEVPVVTISKRSKDEVGIIFERINSTGSALTALDLLVAWTWSEDFHLQEALSELGDTLDGKGFGELPDKLVLQCLGAVLAEDTRTKKILALDPSRVREEFSYTGECIAAAIDFLHTEFKIQSIELLPHLQQIVPLAYFFSHTKTPSATQVSTLRKWFWKTAFSRRYAAQTDEKMNADIRFMKQLIAEDATGIGSYNSEITKDILVKLKFTKSHPYTRALLLLLAQKSPLNLTNGAAIDTGNALSGFNRKEYHHVFPQAFLKKRGLGQDKINALCNFCFLPAGANKKISQKQPSDYFYNVIPEDVRKQILESNLLPLRMEVYSDDDYDAFINLRAELIGQYVDSLVI